MSNRCFFILFIIDVFVFRYIQCDSEPTSSKKKIHFVCTAALIPQNYEARKNQYIESLLLLKKYGCDVYVIESCQSGPTFLDEYCDHVCYTQSNNSMYINKGLNEAISLKIGLRFFDFGADDMIIKFTGRYSLKSDEFIRLVENNPEVDAVVRAWADNDAYSVIFALKLKYFLEFLDNEMIYEYMERLNWGFEHVFGTYITELRMRGAQIHYLPRVYDYLPVSMPNVR